jgi:hypothetical protein
MGFDGISEQTNDLEALFNHGRLLQPPSCPDREFIARALAATSTLFIFFHEFAHIRNGHLDLLASRSGQPFHSETEGATAKMSGLERQALEWKRRWYSRFARLQLSECHFPRSLANW